MMTKYTFKIEDIGKLPDSFDQSKLIIDVETALIEAFSIKEALYTCEIELSPQTRQRLAGKIAALVFDQIKNKRTEAPYISIWERDNEKKIKMVYINPSITEITGFSPTDILRTGFNIFVADDTLTNIAHDEDGTHEEDVPLEQAKVDREQTEINTWNKTYEILTKEGTAFVKDIATIEYIGKIAISTGILIDVTPEIMARKNPRKEVTCSPSSILPLAVQADARSIIPKSKRSSKAKAKA